MEAPSPLTRTLADGLAALRLELRAGAPARLLAYIDLLVRWNRTYNLTAVRDPADMLPRHLLDSLAVLPWLAGPTVADLGSGAGLPGIPLAIARPELAVTLIESNGKKARFLREVARSLPLANVQVEQVRVEAATGVFDTIACRAFASLGDMLALGGHLLAPDGRWLALKGRIDPAEIAGVPAAFEIRAVHPLKVPGIAGERNVVQLAHARARGPADAVTLPGSPRLHRCGP